MAPIKDNTGVPSNKLSVSIQMASTDKSNCKPKMGASKTKGKPDNSQCANILAATNTDKLLGDKAICSNVPSA